MNIIKWLNSIKWRIRQERQKDGTIRYVPEYRKFFIWRKMSVKDHIRMILLPNWHCPQDINYQFSLNGPFSGYTYLLSEEDAEKTIGLCRQHIEKGAKT